MAESKPLTLDTIRASEELQGKKAQLKDLHNLVSPHYAIAWKEIGKELGVPPEVLNALQKNNPDDCDRCCDRMLEEWCNLNVYAKWGTVLKALDSSSVVAVLNSFSNPSRLLRHSDLEMFEAVSKVADRLQGDSKASRHRVSEDDWPPFQPTHFTSVAIIHHKKRHSRKEEIEFIASLQHKGQVDDVGVTQDFSIVFSKLEGVNAFPNTVLIEGAPGIGKTTLCKEMLFQWSNRKLLVHKKLVILVFLRDPAAQQILSLQEFVRSYCNYTQKSNSIIEEYIISTAGKDVVIVLDGYDELSEDIRKDSESFFVKLIHQKCADLLQCTVVITSRLSVSAELHGVVDRRVEILGFTENNRKEYIKQALENNSENVEKLLSYLDRNSAINAYCYIPLNMTILLCLFTEGGENGELPATQTEINEMFICITISRFIRRTRKEKMDCSIANFKEVPVQYKRVFHELCHLAFNALHDDKIVFSKLEVQTFCKHLAHSQNWSGLGLLKAVEFYNVKENKINMSLNFLHLSLQETLAAYHITLLSTRRQVHLFKENFLSSKYFNTWIMYVGLTKGQSFAFKHFLSGNQFQLFTSISLLLSKNAGISKQLITNKVICLHLFQCFSEAENDDMCQYVGQLLQDGEIDLSGQALNAVNVYILGLFLDRSSLRHWKLLNLSNCYLGSPEIEWLCIFSSKVHIDYLDLSYNTLTQTSTDILTKMFFVWKVKKVILCSDSCGTNYNIHDSVRQFATHKLVPLQTEIVTEDESILVLCKHRYQEIIATLLSAKYPSIHLFLCQLGSQHYETNQLVFMLRKTSKNIYLYNCEAYFVHLIESVMISEISLFHITNDSSKSSREIQYAVEKLAEFSITIGEDFLPLHILNMTEWSLVELKEHILGNTHGTFVFRQCTIHGIREILSYFSVQMNITCFTFKKFMDFNGYVADFYELFRHYVSWQHLSLCYCKLQNIDVVNFCSLITSKMLHIILSGNNISNEAAKILARSMINMVKLQHLELERCNLHEEGLVSICNAIQSKNLRTLNFNYNCVTDRVAEELACVITKTPCMENFHISSCSLQHNGIKALLSSLAKIKSLKVFDISQNKLINPSLNLAAVISANPHLEHLNLSYCKINQNVVVKIFKENCMNLKLLNFSGNNITEQATPYLTQVLVKATCLQHLSLSQCYLHETVLIDILKTIRNSLQHFDISFNTISTKAAKSVADVIYNNVNLEHLDLSNCSVQEEGFFVILKAIKTTWNLKYIDLQSIPLNNIMAGELAEFISNNNVLNHLSLSNCALQEEGFLKISNALIKMDVLIHLDISLNNIVNKVGAELAMTDVFFKQSQLKHLDVSECQWHKDSISAMLLATIYARNLKCINCSGCKMDDKEAKYLARSIGFNKTLEQLKLSNCALKPFGLVNIIDELKYINTLKFLNLSHNYITDEASVTLADAILFNQLEHLDLSHCLREVNNLAITVLYAIANSVTLQYLDLSYNDITDYEASYVASAITANDSLHHINLTNNQFTTNSIKIILNAMASIDLIHYINLSSYSITDELACDLEVVAVGNHGLDSIVLDEYAIHDIKEHLPASISKCVVVNKLCLNNCTVDDTGAGTIESLINNSTPICHIDLSYSVFPDLTKPMIVRAMRTCSTLRRLSLNAFTLNQDLENEMASLIAQNTELQHLEMAECKLTETFLVALAQALCTHNELSYLNLSYNTLTPKAVAEVCNMLSNKTALHSLEMVGCELNKVMFLSVAETLTFLNLSNNLILDIHADDVVTLIAKNPNLKNINLSNCGFKSSGIVRIIEALTQTTSLLCLNLRSNHLSEHLELVAKKITAVITCNKAIESLHLPHCIVNGRNMEIFTAAMKPLSSLRYLDITCSCSCNEISSTFYHNIRAVLANNLNFNDYRMVELSVSQSELNLLCNVLPQFRAKNISFYLIQCCISEEYFCQMFEILFNNSYVSYLYIDNHLFSDMHVDNSVLFKALKQIRHLQQLKLNGIILTEDSCDHIASVSAAYNDIKNYYEANSRMSEHGMVKAYKIFKDARSLRNFGIKNVTISECCLCVTDAFKCGTPLMYLNFSNSMVQNNEIFLMCETVKYLTTLVHINVSHNNISNHTAEILKSVINNNVCLQHLELASCSLHEKGIRLILDAIKDRNLQTLNLSYNSISDYVACELAGMIMTKNCIKILQMKSCKLKYSGIREIIAALEKINTLQTLNLSYNKMADITLDITAAIAANVHLKILDLSYCEIHEMIVKSNTSNLRVLSLNGNHMNKFTDIQFICKSACLHMLCLSNFISVSLFETLAAVKHSLQHLDLSFNPISDKAAKLLVDLIHSNTDLEYLNLSNCELQEEGLTLILRAAKKASQLKYINLEANRISDVLAIEAAAFISNNKSLNYISLANCAILEAGFLKIASSLININLVHLDISSNVITNNIAAKLANSEMFHAKSQLKYLNILNCDWQENSFQILLNATVHVKSLRSINISGCEINDAETECLATSITANDTLEQLILANCVIQSGGLVGVLEALKKLSTLNHLDLSYIRIDEEIIPLLVEVMSGIQIEHLNLSHCLLGANHSSVLTAIANSFKLQCLDLSYNNISDDETSWVASALTASGYLNYLNLTNNHFGKESLKTILKAMSRISSLQHVNLDSYIITGELSDDLVAVANSNPGLETVLMLNSKVDLVTLSKENILQLLN